MAGAELSALQAASNDVPTSAAAPAIALKSVSHRSSIRTRPSDPNGAVSREPSRAVNEDSPEIIDVGACRPGRQQVPKLGKEFGRIVVGKKDGRIEAKPARRAAGWWRR